MIEDDKPIKEHHNNKMEAIGILIDRDTARELHTCLEHQFINYKYTKVHTLLLQLQKFLDNDK